MQTLLGKPSWKPRRRPAWMCNPSLPTEPIFLRTRSDSVTAGELLRFDTSGTKDPSNGITERAVAVVEPMPMAVEAPDFVHRHLPGDRLHPLCVRARRHARDVVAQGFVGDVVPKVRQSAHNPVVAPQVELSSAIFSTSSSSSRATHARPGLLLGRFELSNYLASRSRYHRTTEPTNHRTTKG